MRLLTIVASNNKSVFHLVRLRLHTSVLLDLDLQFRLVLFLVPPDHIKDLALKQVLDLLHSARVCANDRMEQVRLSGLTQVQSES